MTELVVHEWGDRGLPTVVLLHGVGNTGGMWRGLAASLTGYHCLAPDLPGHGGSAAVAWRSRPDTAARVAELIEQRSGAGKAHVVGLSLGGSVVIELLGSRPDVIDHAIVDGCGALPSRLTGPMKIGVAAISPLLRFRAVARLIGRAAGVEAGAGLDDFAAQIQAVDRRSFRHAFADANDTPITAGLVAAPCPTLFVAGERELDHVRASNRLLADRMPRAQARMVPDAGHGWGAATRPDLHRAMVSAWLADEPLPGELMPETIPLGSWATVPA